MTVEASSATSVTLMAPAAVKGHYRDNSETSEDIDAYCYRTCDGTG